MQMTDVIINYIVNNKLGKLVIYLSKGVLTVVQIALTDQHRINSFLP